MKKIVTFLSLIIATFFLSSVSLPTLVNSTTITYVHINDIKPPNPLLIESQTDFWISSLVWQTLTWYENGKIYPALAESWTSSGTIWTFKIKKDIFWSNGKPVTPTDIVKYYNKLLNTPANKKVGNTIWLLVSNIRSVKTSTNNDVIFNLFKPDPHFAENVTSNIFILPSSNHCSISNCSIYNGVYTLYKTTSTQVVLKKNSYYKGKAPYGNIIVFTQDDHIYNTIQYPSKTGFQQYDIAVRLVFNTTATPFKTWPYRYLMIATIPYDLLDDEGEAGTPCLIHSKLCHSSLHLDRKVFNIEEFIENYSINIKQLQNLVLYTTPNLIKLAKTITTTWKNYGIYVNIKVLPYHQIIKHPHNSNFVLIPVSGSQSPYTLASPDFPYSKWHYPPFFLKLSEGLTNNQEKLITALEILNYTYPSTTVIFPKLLVQAGNKLKLHTAGLGVPMLTSPIDNTTITTKTNTTATTKTSTISLNNSSSHIKLYFAIFVGMIIVSSLFVLLFILFMHVKHYIPRIVNNIGGIIKQLRNIFRKKNQTVEEKSLKNSKRKLLLIPLSPINNIFKLLTNYSNILWRPLKEKFLFFKSTVFSKTNRTDKIFEKTTETIIAHIEKVGTNQNDNNMQNTPSNTENATTIPSTKTDKQQDVENTSRDTQKDNVPQLKDVTFTPQSQELKEIVEKMEKQESENSNTKEKEE